MDLEKDTWEIILEAITVLIAVLGFTYQIIGFDPQKRRRLKTDLEILKIVKELGLIEEQNRISEHIKSRVPDIYRKPSETDTIVRIPDLQRLVVGIILTLFFSGVTIYYYIDRGGFQWWMLINIFFILSGLGNIMLGVNGEQKKGD